VSDAKVSLEEIQTVTEIILTSDQAQLFASAIDGIVIADSAGNVFAKIPPKISIPPKILEEEAAIVAEARRRLASDQPRIPSSEVLERLNRLNQQANS